MNNAFSFLIAIVFLVLALNAAMLFLRHRNESRTTSRRAAMEESEAVKWREKEINRRLDREQEDAEKYVELRNRTLDLYEQVRRNAAAGDSSGSSSDET